MKFDTLPGLILLDQSDINLGSTKDTTQDTKNTTFEHRYWFLCAVIASKAKQVFS